MNYVKYLFCVLFLLIVSASLTGCFIIGASPDTNEIVYMKPGESKLFQVVGPKYSQPGFFFYEWVAIDRDGSEIYIGSPGDNDFEFNTERLDKIYNKIELSCRLIEMQPYVHPRPCPGQDNWAWPFCLNATYPTIDEVLWSIKIIQDPPTWNGDYYIEDNTDLQELNSFSEITGDLVILRSVLTNLNGLSNITSIGGDLRIQNNDVLVNLDGLSSLCSVGEGITIEDNPELCTASASAEALRDQILSCDPDGVSGDIIIEDNKDCP